jgi:hypothetical protein
MLIVASLAGAEPCVCFELSWKEGALRKYPSNAEKAGLNSFEVVTDLLDKSRNSDGSRSIIYSVLSYGRVGIPATDSLGRPA